MLRATLVVKSESGEHRVPMDRDDMTVGRGATADLTVDDVSLSRLHASVHRSGDRYWVLDEGSTNGTFVNGKTVPSSGRPLKNGDVISIGEHTTIKFILSEEKIETSPKPPVEKVAIMPGEAKKPDTPKDSMSLLLTAAFFLVFIGIVIFILVNRDNNQNHKDLKDSDHIADTADSTDEGKGIDKVEETPGAGGVVNNDENLEPLIPAGRKLYTQMSEQEKIEFIDERAQQIAMMIGNRPYAFTDDVIIYIKKYVDGYASRASSSSTRLWGEGLRSLYGRASKYSPYIIRSFNERGVPPALGLYIAMIETEYHDCLESPVGAKGLFQFMPETARGYGVDPADRCDVKKMAPAAARYMADRITEFGSDSMSVALAIAGYNRSPDSVRRDLHDVLSSENRERSFWTLVANSTMLDRPFQNENIKYVPKFFAAAIVGETPWAFNLAMRPLSTYTVEGDVGPAAGVVDTARMKQIERACVEVMRRISSDDKPYVFSEKALQDIGRRAEECRADPALSSALNSLTGEGPALIRQARQENLEPALLIYTALAETMIARGNVTSNAQKALPDMVWLKATFGTGLAEGSLIMVAAYRMGVGTKKSHPLLASMRRVVKDPLTQRNVWYLHESGAIDQESYNFVLTFLAAGAIAQNPRQFGVDAPPPTL
jgi:pSer/pThr/pTyr-binding forkhead associated (FHA) protein